MKKILAIFLMIVLGLSVAFPSFALGVPTQKDEVVYAVLDLDGSIDEIYVVSSFKGGTITDYGNYSSVSNMSSAEKLTQSGDAITIDSKEDNFYYQGTLESKKLPWNIEIKYELDNKEILASELAGKNGELTITMNTMANKDVNDAFFENYMLQITLMLDTDKCEEINSANATLANAGKDKVITHTVMPGENANIIITAKVKDFAMSGFEITALPLSIAIEMPDTEGLTEGMMTLSDAVNALDQGMKELSDGIGKSYVGTQKIKGGSINFANGLSQIDANSAGLVSGSTQIKQGLVAISAGLEGGSFNPEELAALPGALRQFAGGLDQISGKVPEIKNGYAQIFATLGTEILKIPEGEVDPTTLYTLISDNPEMKTKLDQLMNYYSTAKTVRGTYTAILPGLAEAEGGLDTMSTSIATISAGLSQAATGIEQSLSEMDVLAQMQQLKDGLGQLTKSYGEFHNGLKGYVGGVSSLSNNYVDFNTGLRGLADGMGELNAGGKELAKGSGQLNDAVADLPNTIKTEIDKIADQYDKSDFVPVSFVSEKNTNVRLVQFVIKTASIERVKDADTDNAVPAKLNFWQKLLKLFGL